MCQSTLFRALSLPAVVCAIVCVPAFAQQPHLKCGSHCLYVAAILFDSAPDHFEDLEQLLGPPRELGYSMDELKGAAESLGLYTLPVNTTLENLNARDQQFACICHIKGNHFVLLADAIDGEVVLVDPPAINHIPDATFLTQWSGTALLVSAAPLTPEADVANRVHWHRRLRLAGYAAVAVVVSCTICVLVYRRWRPS